ncbi:MAG: TonB-dependent receptor [Bacteroidales bacterium]|nr:TonB-dependent receptor [Bacteroidales bacterium]
MKHHFFRRWLVAIGLVLACVPTFAQRRTISGYVMDAASKETLIGATVFDKNSGKGCATNSYGFYTLTLSQGDVELQVSYVGYTQQTKSIELKENLSLNFALETNTTLDEVVVEGTRATVSARSPQMSVVELPVQQIKSIPTLFGEADVLKAIQLLPGVQNGSEGSAGMYVRGGGPDENLLLLDGVPVYNVNHALGFFSVFNPDALKNVTLYKGSFPAHFGGRLSSVVDIRMKEGDMQQYHGNFSIGLISSKFNLEGPIVKDKLSFNLSFRRTYGDLLIKPALWMASIYDSDIGKLNVGYHFYDFNGKLNWKISDKDRLYLSFYTGDDAINFGVRYRDYSMGDDEDLTSTTRHNDNMGINWKWGNKVASLRWNHVMSQQLFMDASVNYTQYRHHLGMDMSEETIYTYQGQSSTTKDAFEMAYKSGINDLTAKVDFDYTPLPNHEIRFGGNYTYHQFRPEVQSMKITTSNELDMDTVTGASNVFAHETALYAEDNMTFGDIFRVNAGVHYSTFTVEGKTYHSVQPRLSASVMLASNLSLKAGYANMTQYVHLLSNSSLSLPTDLWVPVTKNVVPMNAHQVSLGAFYELPRLFDISVESYYKTMDNLMEYKDGASFFGSIETWENKICLGKGWAYGVEFLVQRSFGKTTGWVGYTWAHSERQFDREGMMINNGEVFPAKYDRRHDISITVQHKFSDRFDLSGTWVFSSGNCGTLGTQIYEGLLPNNWGSISDIQAFERNNFRMPSYHRLDVGMNFHKQKKHGIRTWNISVYNAYNHNNPFIVYTDYQWDAATDTERKVLMQVSLFPIIPSVSYSFKF